jgi:predicted DNA-binding protein (UPF0278 family)
MDYKVELVAQAFYEAEHDGSLWENEPAILKEQFREYARNAIRLLNEDIGVLLLALERSAAEERMRAVRERLASTSQSITIPVQEAYRS